MSQRRSAGKTAVKDTNDVVPFLAKGETWSLEDLTANPRNVKIHADEDVGQLVESMRQFGFTFPVLVSEEGEIIAGHGRVLAARVLKLAEVPVIVARGWTPEMRRAYAIADNKHSQNTAIDQDMLAAELSALLRDGVDMSGVGFSQAELAVYMPKDDTEFLAGLGGDGGADDDGDDPHTTSRGVNLNLNYSPEERDRVVRFLKREAGSRGLKTTAQALLALADEGTS